MFRVSEMVSGFGGSLGFGPSFGFVYTETETFGNASGGFDTHV